MNYSLCVVQITTGYNLEDDRCECVALQDYKENEQVSRVRVAWTYGTLYSLATMQIVRGCTCTPSCLMLQKQQDPALWAMTYLNYTC